MKVLFATHHSYLPQRTGGSQASTHDLAVELTRLGHEVGVLCHLSRGGLTWFRNRLISRRQRRGFPADSYGPYRVFRGQLLGNLAAGVREVLEQFTPDVAVVQAGRPIPLVAAFLARDVPTLLYVRDVEFDKHGGDIPQHSHLRVVANSRFTAHKLKQRSGLDPVVIPPLVRRDSYAVARPRGESVLFVNPVPVKGLEIAIGMAAANPDIPFVFLESWPLSKATREDLQRRLAGLGNVKFRRSLPDMRTAYRGARLVLIPSQVEEAWGRVATEAHFSGIPVIASNIGGLPESVGPGGVLIPPTAGVEAWTEALRHLWTDPSHYRELSQAALDYASRPAIAPRTIVTELMKQLEAVRAQG